MSQPHLHAATARGGTAEPDWLAELTAAAAARLEATSRPTAQLEEWRYSRVGDVELGGAGEMPVPVLSPDELATLRAETDEAAANSGSALVVDGHLIDARIDPGTEARGVRLVAASDLAECPVPGPRGLVGDWFVALGAASGPDPLVLVVPRGVVVDRPILVRTESRTPGVSLPRVIVAAADDAEATVIWWQSGPDGAEPSTAVAHLDLHVAPAARVQVRSVQTVGRNVDVVATVSARVDRDATLRLSHVALGGRYARCRFDWHLAGRGAHGELAAVYLGDHEQMHDLRTFVEHDAPDTTSDLDFRGALDDRAHAVYTGLVRVGEEARGTNAQQSNRIVKLSDDTWAESVPNLEIHHNDVRCSHASTVGPIDEDQRFYLESRGVDPEAAQRLVVGGFFEEVLAQFPAGGLDRRLRTDIAARLGSAS